MEGKKINVFLNRDSLKILEEGLMAVYDKHIEGEDATQYRIALEGIKYLLKEVDEKDLIREVVI